jgi:hypothetical protein
MNSNLLAVNFEKLHKASILLRDTVSHLAPLEPATLNSSRAMEPYDALASRFERFVEIAVNRFFRSVELVVQGKQSETLRDRLHVMCKAGLISSPELWMEMRDFRNRIAHDYLPEQLVAIFEGIRTRFLVEIDFCVNAAKAFTDQNKEG